MKHLQRFFLLISLVFITACTAPSGTVSMNYTNSSTDNYINKFAPVAIKEMNRVKIPASITMAQGILESNNGNSELSRIANNHFGIKCHEWKGKRYYHDDDERNECFRHYNSAWESYRDHSDFLVTNKRYRFLFEYDVKDYKSWAHGLKKAGYATDPQYPKKLIALIETHQLYLLDQGRFVIDEPLAKEPDVPASQDPIIKTVGKHKIYVNNRVNYIFANESDSYASIANEFELFSWELYKFNDLPKSASITKGQRIYIEPKQRKAERGINYHTVKEGETMYTIAQKYGVKLKNLYEMNGLKVGDKLSPGQTLLVRPKSKKQASETPLVIEFDY